MEGRERADRARIERDPVAERAEGEPVSDAMGTGGATGDEQPTARRRSRDVRVAVTGAVAVLLVWFAVANLQDVPIHFWVKSAAAPLIVVVAISGVLGASVAGLVGRATRRRREDDRA
jgi:uncharacterized integral membrane protein